MSEISELCNIIEKSNGETNGSGHITTQVDNGKKNKKLFNHYFQE